MMKRFLILLTMLLAMFGCTSYQEAENTSEQGSSNSEQGSSEKEETSKSAAYKVMHYKQNANDSEYTLVTTDTENKTGTVGDYAYATVKSYEGFTAKQIEHIKIKADGSTVVKIYYDRKEVTLMLNLDGGTGNTMITGKYGANINIQNPTKAGYVFFGWNPALPATFPLSPSLHTATWITESDTVVLGGCTYTKDMKNLLSAEETITSVTIPDSVTGIGKDAFAECNNIENVYISDLEAWCNIEFKGNAFANPLSNGAKLYLNDNLVKDLVIPDSVTSLNFAAFYGCESLENVTIPDSVTTIGKSAFCNCSSLTSVVIGDSVTSIGNYAFDGCGSLESVTIPDSVTSIGGSVFENCSSLTSVYITDLTTWCNIKFEGWFSNPLFYANNLYLNGSLVTDLVIPDSVTTIGKNAFDGCGSLESVTIPDSVTSIGDSAFSGCSSLTSIVIPDSVTSISKSAFSVCSKLATVTIGNSVTSIGGGAFFGCDSLTSVEIPDSVTSIGNDAFCGCDSLTSVVIPDSVTSIESRAFGDCSSLTSVVIGNGVKYIADYVFLDCDNVETLVIGDGLTSLNNLPITSALKSITIGSGVSIKEDAFKDCSSLESVVIASIGDCVFNECNSLASVTIANGVTSVGNYAFKDCSSLTSVVIPDSVTSIGKWTFSGCDSLIYNEYDNGLYLGNADNPYLVLVKAKDTSITSCEINSKTKIILSNAFDGCENIETLIIGDGITSLDNLPITSALKSLAIPNGVTEIKANQFKDCINLSSITIPASVTSIGYDAFSNCDNLANVYISDLTAWCNIKFANEFANPLDNVANLYLDDTLVKDLVIPDDVTSVSSYAFSGCYSLTNVTIPDSVTSIGDCVFNECSNLASVTIGNGVTSIGGNAFSNCDNLANVYLSDLTAWCNIEFSNSNANPLYYANNLYLNGSLVKDLVIPNDVTSIGEYAFYNYDTLTSVTIPNSVTSIGWEAFYNSGNLTSVYISDLTAWCNIEFSNSNANPLCYANNLYLNGSLVKDLVIPNDVTTIGRYAFYNYDTLTSVTIGDSVTSIGWEAFEGCSNLTSVTIGDSETSIGYEAFKNCDSLTSVVIPDSVTSIGSSAFEGCSSLTSVTIGNGVTSIGNEAFYGCSSLTSVTIGNSVTSIGNEAFYGCSSLTSVIIPDSVTSIGNDAFSNCSKLASVTIGSGVTKIYKNAFSSCWELRSATFKDTDIWYYTSNSDFSDGIGINVTDPAQNATYLESTYVNKYWYKK